MFHSGKPSGPVGHLFEPPLFTGRDHPGLLQHARVAHYAKVLNPALVRQPGKALTGAGAQAVGQSPAQRIGKSFENQPLFNSMLSVGHVSCQFGVAIARRADASLPKGCAHDLT